MGRKIEDFYDGYEQALDDLEEAIEQNQGLYESDRIQQIIDDLRDTAVGEPALVGRYEEDETTTEGEQ